VPSTSRRLYQLGSAVARRVPLAVAIPLAEGPGGWLAERFWPCERDQLIRNLRRVRPDASPQELAVLARRGLGSYARYWVESFKLPSLSPRAIDDGFAFAHVERILDVRDAGSGPIMVLPHLGGWEWAAAWLTRVAGVPVTAVVEALEPPALFEWFVELRSSIGINVVPLGPRAAGEVVRAVRERHVVCLVADRDLSGTGVPVEFFGARTTLPAGPAVLGRRLGTAVLPTAVYFDGHLRRATVGEPLDLSPGPEGFKQDVARITADLARVLEHLIGRAPDQWHLLSPNWPDECSPGTASEGPFPRARPEGA
jgi:phosphatidylinositol dimannoside acyltransferase